MRRGPENPFEKRDKKKQNKKKKAEKKGQTNGEKAKLPNPLGAQMG